MRSTRRIRSRDITGSRCLRRGWIGYSEHPEHFARFVGSKVKVQLALPIEGRRRFTGALLAAGDEGVTLEVDGSPVLLAYQQIQKARLVPML